MRRFRGLLSSLLFFTEHVSPSISLCLGAWVKSVLINSPRWFRLNNSFSFAGDPHSFSPVDLVPKIRGGAGAYKNWASLSCESYWRWLLNVKDLQKCISALDEFGTRRELHDSPPAPWKTRFRPCRSSSDRDASRGCSAEKWWTVMSGWLSSWTISSMRTKIRPNKRKTQPRSYVLHWPNHCLSLLSPSST